MATAPTLLDNVIRPAPGEEKELERLRQQIGAIFHRQQSARLIGPDGETIELPSSAFHALELVVQAMARGQTITLVPHGKELTTQEAADLLHVSRPYLIGLLDEGVLPHHRVGTHRRLLIEDVLAYRERRAVERRRQLRELTRLSEETPGGYR
jgi:excisionase family DNA binding protein